MRWPIKTLVRVAMFSAKLTMYLLFWSISRLLDRLNPRR
jgi:hypothetical protein